MSVGKLSFKILPLLLLFCTNYPPITCQNCGLPSTIRLNEQLAEVWKAGQLILEETPTYNVANISRITNNPGDFAKVELVSEANLLVTVAKPLWDYTNISFVDKSRLSELDITVELECSDGGHKDLHIIVPIIDDNTATPKYEHDHYELTTEPCMLEKCALIFERDITVIDKDMVKENAQVFVWTDEPTIAFLPGFSVIEPWYEEGEDGRMDHKGYQSRVKLEYIPSKDIRTWRDSISFQIYVNNTVQPADGAVFIAFSTVTINFVEKERMLPPVFTSSLYYAVVNYVGEQVYTHPRNIYASAPGQKDNETIESTIEYLIQGEPDVFHIDCKGELSFIKDIGIKQSSANRIDYNVTAIRRRIGREEEVNATVPLIVFFIKDFGTTPEPPVCECESSPTPWPGTCPTPTCPDPEPCPGITTTPTPTTGPSYGTTTTTTPRTTTTPTTTTTTPPGNTTTPTTTTMTPPRTTTTSTTTTTPRSTTENPEITDFPTGPPVTDFPTGPPVTDFPTDSTEATDPTDGTTPPPEGTDQPTTYLPPTIPPGDCTCDCTDFSCKNPQVQPGINSTVYNYYRDPYSCTRYHLCPHSESDPVDESDQLSFECDPETIFCPTTSACMTVEMCLARTLTNVSLGGGDKYGLGFGYGGNDSGEEECHECHCRVGLPPGHPENLCNIENYEMQIPDPTFCDVFHKCQETQEGSGSYIDYPMRCPAGTVFCPAKNHCDHPYTDGCACPKIFQQCDVCQMGAWVEQFGFDIFKKTFASNV